MMEKVSKNKQIILDLKISRGFTDKTRRLNDFQIITLSTCAFKATYYD